MLKMQLEMKTNNFLHTRSTLVQHVLSLIHRVLSQWLRLADHKQAHLVLVPNAIDSDKR